MIVQSQVFTQLILLQKKNSFTDCRRGQSLVVWAINEGRQAAREVDAYLMGTSTLPVSGGVVQITQKG